MSNELTVSASMSYADAFKSDELILAAFSISPSSPDFRRVPQTIGSTDTLINLAAMTTPGVMLIINRDPNIGIDLKDGLAGHIWGHLDPVGGHNFAFLKLGSANQTPYAIVSSGVSANVDLLAAKA
jgi:hypothetical protein